MAILEEKSTKKYKNADEFVKENDLIEELEETYGTRDPDEILNLQVGNIDIINTLLNRYNAGKYYHVEWQATEDVIKVIEFEPPLGGELSFFSSEDADIYAENHDAFCYIWNIQGTEHIYSLSFTPQGNNALTATVERRTLEDKLNELKNQNYEILRKET